MTYLYCYDRMFTKKTQRGVQDDGNRKDQKADKKFFMLERGRKNVHGSVGGSACPSFYSRKMSLLVRTLDRDTDKRNTARM